MKRIKPKPSERGITLIALVIMIIILVILAAVGIRALTGKNNLIGTTETAVEDYNITSYKEQIMQQVRSVIIAHANLGEEIGISQIAEELNEETIWVKSAVANTDTSITNEDIIVKVTDGYAFQVYYNNVYGTVFIEYVGKDKGEEPPNIKARYEKSIASIVYEVTDSSSEIEKVEVIYRGEVKHTEDKPGSGEKRYNISEVGTGWYILKVTSSSGKLRYAWIKGNNISDKLTPPVISIEPASPNGEAGWYKTGVKVTMTTDSPSAKEIRYRTVAGVSNEDQDNTGEGTKYDSTFDFDTNGSTTIYAWTKDDKGYVSEEAKVTFKIDTIKPTIVNPAKITPTKPQVNGWYVSGVEIEIEGADEGSGLNGYYYMIKGEDTEWKFKDKSEKMKIGENDREGITEIVVKTVDIAGNESNQININIPKDTVKPNFNSINITNETETGFTVNAYATDPEPSSTINGQKITYECYITEVGTSERKQIDQGSTNETGIFNITGLGPKKSYDVEVIAKDPAGHTASNSIRGTTKGELLAPHIEVKGNTQGGYYIGDVEVTITDTASEETTRGTKIRYNKNGTNYTQTGRSYTFTISEGGDHTIVAYMVDDKGITSPASTSVTIRKDTQAPNTPSITFSGTTGENGYYKGNITMTITPGTDSGSGTKGIGYRILRGSETVVAQTTKDTTSATNVYTGSTDGTYTVYAYTIDNAGNKSAEVSNTASKDSTVPNGPTVSPTTSANSNGWYKANVTVNITAGTDSISGAYKLRYSTNGGTSYTTTSAGVTTASVTVSTEGTNNIIAYTIDKAGNVSTNTGTATIKLDKTAPSISSVTSTGTSESAASMTVNAGDTGGSGIDQYKFYIGTSTTPKTTSTTKTASVTGLTRGSSNTVNVIVTDKAGNESTRTSKTVETKLYKWTQYELLTITSYKYDRVCTTPR